MVAITDRAVKWISTTRIKAQPVAAGTAKREYSDFCVLQGLAGKHRNSAKDVRRAQGSRQHMAAGM